MRIRLVFVAVLLVAFVHPGRNAGVRAQGPATIRCGIDMRNVSLRVAEHIVLDVRTLSGELVSLRPGAPPVFDDAQSYRLQMASADVSMGAESLTALMGQVFTKDTAVRDVKVTIVDGQLRQAGKLHKGVTVPFSMRTNVSVTADGRLRLHADSLKAVGIPVKGMLDLFGVELDNLMKAPGRRGLQIDGDDILLSPAEILPPPKTEGRVTSVQVSGDRLVMRMVGDAKPSKITAPLPEPGARNYLYFHGGVVRFGKLTMTDADLQLVDADPKDAFDFFPDKYLDQLVAGFSRTTRRGGLRVRMPDYADLKTGRTLAAQ